MDKLAVIIQTFGLVVTDEKNFVIIYKTSTIQKNISTFIPTIYRSPYHGKEY